MTPLPHTPDSWGDREFPYPRKHFRCTAPGCDNKHRARGFCSKHYKVFRAQGGQVAPKYTPARDFFEQTVLTCTSDDCLIWPFSRNNMGYGQLAQGSKRPLVHRIACERVHGPAPSSSHEAAHSCGNGHLGCVNPQHVRWATRAENMIDMVQHGRSARGERSSFAKLTADDVKAIRRSRPSTPSSLLAQKYGVTQTTICDVVRGKSWAHLED